jgi:8-oxo-dGTP diphosphatase
LRNQDEVLIGMRINTLGAGYRGFPGGHVEFGESPIDCAIRELKEEA